MAEKTDRLYLAAQTAFLDWCASESISFPAEPIDVARYLRRCLRRRGPSAVPVHLAAIGRHYRKLGYQFDTRQPAIQAVTKIARAEMAGDKPMEWPFTKADDPTIEFDCEGCGNHVIQFGGDKPASQLCSVCAWLCEHIPDPAEMIELHNMLRRGTQ